MAHRPLRPYLSADTHAIAVAVGEPLRKRIAFTGGNVNARLRSVPA